MVTISAGHIIPVASIACLGVQRNTVSLQHTATSLDIWRYILDRQQITRTGQHSIWQNFIRQLLTWQRLTWQHHTHLAASVIRYPIHITQPVTSENHLTTLHLTDHFYHLTWQLTWQQHNGQHTSLDNISHHLIWNHLTWPINTSSPGSTTLIYSLHMTPLHLTSHSSIPHLLTLNTASFFSTWWTSQHLSHLMPSHRTTLTWQELTPLDDYFSDTPVIPKEVKIINGNKYQPDWKTLL